MINRRTIHIEWGDCDPAQIVYYPRYFEYFDSCTAALFAKAGFPKREMLKTYGIVGFPLVEVKSRFMAPSHFSEEVVVESEITEWRNSSFYVHHKLFKGKVLAVECIETRVWAVQSATDPEKIESRPVPREVIAKFGATRSKKLRKKKSQPTRNFGFAVLCILCGLRFSFASEERSKALTARNAEVAQRPQR